MLADILFTLRSLRRQPAFTLAAIATLAVGIGATTAIFSTVNAVLLRPLPFPQPDDLRALYAPATDGRFTSGRDSGVEIQRLNEPPSPSIVHAAGSSRFDSTLIRDDNTPVPLVMHSVTEGFFQLFGLPLALGPGFSPEHHRMGTAPAVVLSHRMWREMFHSEPGMVGRSIRLMNGPVTVVGIAARDFDVPHGTDAWMNAVTTPQSTGHGFDGYLRVKPGASPERLRDEMAVAMAGIARDYGAIGENRKYDIKPLVEAMVGELGSTLLVVMSAAALLLLLASVNVTNLLLARGAVRSREIAVRVALGAGRGRILRQLLTESLVLSTAGTALGLLLAYVGVRMLRVLGASELPRLDSIPFDARVLGFVLIALVVTGILVGFAPALRLTATDLRTLLNESGRSATGSGAAHRTLKTMIVAEIALAITLVAGAGWLVRSFANLGRSDPGFVADGRLVFDVVLPGSRYRTLDQLNAWTRTVTERLRAVAGVKTVGSASTFPFGPDTDGVLYIGIAGDTIDPNHPLVSRARRVSPEFFQAMGTRMVAGRPFSADDRQDTERVAIVNRTFARRYLAGHDPLAVKFASGYPEVDPKSSVRVIGVVDDVRYVSLALPADPMFYMAQAQAPYFRETIVLDTSMTDPTAIAPMVRSAMKELDPLIPVEFHSFNDIVSVSLSRQRLGMTLMILFAVAALVLAAVGIYGVIAYASAQRVGEVATRMALGATPANVFWLMLNQGRWLSIAGTVLGAAAAYVSGRIVSSRLFEVRAGDPLILVAATLIVLAIAVAAMVVPARRMSHTDPSRILRME